MTSSNHTSPLEASAPLSMDGDFFLTELAEQPGSKILYRFGTVQANSRHAPNDDDLAARQKMNQAVRTIITEACRRGANGIVSLRVEQLFGGRCTASGEAVLLTNC